MKKIRRIISMSLIACMILMSLVGCGKKNSGDNTVENPNGNNTENNSNEGSSGEENGGEDINQSTWEALDPNATGDVSIMVWSGDSVYYEDLGHQDWTPDDISTQNVAAIYAMAKKFNETYPNIKINLYAKADDPNGNDTSWDQELENFKAEHGKYPDIYASTDLVGDTSRGLVADLSVFADDPIYQSFNDSIMGIMNYYGFQAGLPQFIQPWGVYVNKELAEQNNIDVPDPDWNIDEYTKLATSGDNETFWGSLNPPISFISTGTKDIVYSMFNYSGEGNRVNLTSEAVADLLSYIPEWSKSAIFSQNDLGNVPTEIMDDGWWWGYRFFCRNYALTYDGDPWMLGAAADPTGEVNVIESNDWDIYPRPSTDYQDNTIGICVDPMAVHNYAMDDGNPEWSEEEKANLKIAYTFGAFWSGSTEAMQARADQTYSDNGSYRSALNDSFPLVTGEEFNKQMDIWYSIEIHKRYQDADLMPGFQYVLELWEKGQFWDVSDKTYPYFVTVDGAKKECLYEWLNINSADVVGAKNTDSNWLDNVKAKLADWNVTINERFVESEQNLKDGLTQYYGFTETDFSN